MAAFYFNNLLRSSTIVSEDTLTDFEAFNALDGRTSTQVGMVSGASRDLIFDLGSAQTFGYVAVSAHNLSGTAMGVSGSNDNVSYSAISTISYDNNNVRVDEITESTYRYIRMRFSGHSQTIYIADLFLGMSLDLLYGIPYGFTPPEQADQDEIRTNLTGSGAIVGISIKRKPKLVNLSLTDYPLSWFESNWLEFIESLKQYPAYFLWAPGKRAMYFTFDRKIGMPVYRSNSRQSIRLRMYGFVE